MSKVNTIEQDNMFVRYLIIISGITILSIGINGFLRQAHLLSGGIAGMSTAINYLTNINIGLIAFLLNIPIFILAYIFLEKDFLLTSLVNMEIFSFILGVTQNVGQFISLDDILLQSIFGGVLCGIGNGLVFRTKSSTGGTDIISAILKRKFNIPMKTTSFAINIAIISVGAILFGLDLALYTLIAMFLNAQVMNYIKDALNDEKAIMVFSNNVEEIGKEIMGSLVRGVTFIDAEGGYTHKKKKIIYCVALSREVPKIKEIALKYDQRAFISVNDINEVKGKGFKEKSL